MKIPSPTTPSRPKITASRVLFQWNIRRRLQISAASVAGIILCVVVGWGYFSGKKEIYHETRSRAMFLAQGAAAIFDGRMLRQQGTMRGIASALDSDGIGISLAQAKKLQEQILLEDKEIFGVCIALAPGFSPVDPWQDRAPYTFRRHDGSLSYRNFDDIEIPSLPYWEEPWFALAEQKGKPVWCPPYRWEDVLMVSFSCPIWSKEGDTPRFIGVVACDLTLEWIDKQLASLPAGPDDYALLMDRDSLYVAHPQKELVLKKTMLQIAEERDDANLHKFASRMISGSPGVEEHISFVTNKKSWVAYVPLHSTDWIFAAVLSQDNMRNRLASLAIEQGGIAIGGLFFLLVALAWVARTITVPVETLHRAARTLADGDLQAPLPTPNGEDEVADLTRSFSTMRDHLIHQMEELASSTASRERMASELRIAHEIQMSLVPKELPPNAALHHLDFCALLEPAREIGGDFYDFFPISETEIVLLIGDVSGKGVPAALHMAATRSLLRSFFKTDTDPGRVLELLNRELAPDNPTCMFVTLFCATLRLSDGLLRYSSAGHNPPLLISPHTPPTFLHTPGAPPVGVLLSTHFPTDEMILSPGVTLLLYTDGVTEANNLAKDLYGEDRLQSTAYIASACCEKTIDAVIDGVRRFVDGAPASDDITLLAIKRPAKSPLQPPLSPSPDWCRNITAENGDCLAALDELESWLKKYESCPELHYSVRLALEELATNAIKYAQPTDASPYLLRASFFLRPSPVLTVETSGSTFNPWQDAPTPDTSAPASERSPGGLGLHLVRSLASQVSCEHLDSSTSCRITFFCPNPTPHETPS